MKTITVHEWDGILLSLFQMDTGDKIARHSHPFQHTTGVARGRTKVTIWHPGGDEEYRWMQPGIQDFAFPPDLDHEIEALEDGTIVVNLCHVITIAGEPARSGGLMLEDGTVIHDP